MNTVFLDIETTGLDPLNDEIVEVAAILRPDNVGLPERTFHFSLPINVERASAKALEVNRYHERREELEEIQLNKMQAADLLREALEGAMVVGNNVQFDLRFIEQLILDTPWHYCPLDLKAFVGGRCGMKTPAQTKTIADVSGVQLPKDAHSALVDASWNRDVYNALTGATR